MALGVPSSSPAVVIKEVDASASIQTAATTVGGSVGNFRWGPVNTPITISNETELASTFGNPDDTHIRLTSILSHTIYDMQTT